MTNLFLASSSPTRQLLLREAGFPCEILTTRCIPEPFNPKHTIKQNAQAAAECKAKLVNLPTKTARVAPVIYVICADTLIASTQGEILQKPTSRAHAEEQLTKLGSGTCTIGTACIIQKFAWNAKKGWILKKIKHIFSKSTADFIVPKDSFDAYFTALPIALHVCGAGIIEGFGSQFLKKFSGSHSGALGLPMFELKKALQDLGWSRI